MPELIRIVRYGSVNAYLEPARLAPGHGRVVEAPAAAMAAAIERAA